MLGVKATASKPIKQTVSDSPKGKSLFREIRSLVEKWSAENNKTHAAFAAECGVYPADLGHFLGGDRSLPPYAIANIAVQLQIDPIRLLMRFEMQDWAEKSRQGDDLKTAKNPVEAELFENRKRGWEIAKEAMESLVARLPSETSARTEFGGPRTLAGWPEAFLPLIVFVGDRREQEPRSPADLLAASASTGDLYYLPRLRLPPDTEIRSDKTVVITTPEKFKEIIKDKNLLVIGSPAANLMARAVNGGACFSFHVDPDALIQSREFQKMLEPIKYFPEELEKFTDQKCETELQKEWTRKRHHMAYQFARSGILDPVDFQSLRGTVTTTKDYGVVTLCRHPWSNDHVAVMAAGLHGPATAGAVKLLSTENAFAEHSLGGVFHVSVPNEAPWEDRYHHMKPEWDSHPYTLEKYEEAVMRTDGRFSQMTFWNPKEVLELLKAIKSKI
jgi:hypothetical protein